MCKKLSFASLVIFTLLMLTSSADASALTIDYLNLDFGNGFKVIGDFEVTTLGDVASSPFPTLYFNLSPLPTAPVFGGHGGLFLYDDGNVLRYSFPFPSGFGPTPATFHDFTLNDVPAVSGSVACLEVISEGEPNGAACSVGSPTPIPNTLPILAAVLLSLIFLGTSRRYAGLKYFKKLKLPF